MIFKTLLPHAQILIKSEQIKKECFVLDSCRIDVDSFEELFGKNLEESKPKKKLDLPIQFHGKIEKHIPGRFQGNNIGNASQYTFKKKKTDFPEEWFFWLKNNQIEIKDFISLIRQINNVSLDSIYQLFAQNGPFFTFNSDSKKTKNKSDNDLNMLENMVANSVYQPIVCRNSVHMVHSVLALNALNEKAALFGETTDPALIRKEFYRFSLLFWIISKFKDLDLVDEDSGKRFKIEKKISGYGNMNDISNLPLLLNMEDFYLGVHTESVKTNNPVVQKFLSLTREKSVDRIVLKDKVFTAPKTGKSPTNAFRNDRQNTLMPYIMLGFENQDIYSLIPAYSSLIQDKMFKISKTSLGYYVFPENPDSVSIEKYLPFLTDMIAQLKQSKTNYFDHLKKIDSTSSKEKEKELREGLERVWEDQEAIWGKSWSRFKLKNLLFAFEENVGSDKQKQYAWTSVYRQLPASRTFLFLRMIDDPKWFGRFTNLLDKISFNLSAGWKEKEIKRLFNWFFLYGKLDQVEYWVRWRKYLSQSKGFEAQTDKRYTDLWEHGMSLIIQINAINYTAAELPTEVEDEWSGKMLLSQLQQRRNIMNDKNESAIKEYLKNFFFTGISTQEPDKREMDGTVRVMDFIQRQAKSYAGFVDTESDNWQVIIDGLICGWALKRICLKIRKDDYHSLIGGKSLAKYTPTQLRSLSIDLYNKAERALSAPWNVQAPLEKMFKWSQKSSHASEVQLFMDAVSLGFIRFDGNRLVNSENNINQAANEENVQ